MTYVILDLEWNGSYSKRDKKYYNEIIEFGAVKVDEELNIISTFSMLITPHIGKKLNNRISRLTHITDEELENADNSFIQVNSAFRQFLGDSVLLTWGISDIHTLMENYSYYFKTNRPAYLKKYCNLQAYCEYALNIYDKSKQVGLSACAEKLGINSDELTLHRALTDAELSLLCFRKLQHREDVNKYIETCDDEFYRKMTFRTCYITDINNPLIDKSKMVFDCPDCNKKVKRKSKWIVKNRCFRAKFHCNHCNKEFMGRITYKLRYEGISVLKKITPIIEEKENKEENKEDK